METAPFFSIIIPCFNSAKFLEVTLSSLSAQTFNDFEVIVVDDGSSDDSPQQCEKYFAANGLKGQIVRRPADRKKGVASCRNLGVELCNGDWVCFLDADDLFFPEKLQRIYTHIQSYSPACLAYYHNVEHFENETNNKLPHSSKERDEFPVNILDELLQYNFIVTSSVTIQKRLFIDIGGFDDKLHGVEDYFLWLRVAKRSKWCYCNSQLTGYRIMNDSLMRGRELTYYVSQSDALLACAFRSREFSREELGKIENYMFRDQMFFYAGNSLKRKGKKDFFNGMFALMKVGKVSLSSAIMLRHLKFACLQYATRVFKGTKGVNNAASR